MTAASQAKDIEALQQRLDYHFKDLSLLDRALTHSSLSNQPEPIRDLERLEFLGDRVLGLLTAEELWRRYPDYSEGDMAPRLNALVRKEACAQAAREIGLGEVIRLSPGEEEAGGRNKDAILGDVCEALLGALYVDGGLDAARKAYALYWLKDFDRLARNFRDAKTTLQEWAQAKTGNTPTYKVSRSGGPAHRPRFDVTVTVAGYKPADGDGGSKQSAQMAAAQAFLLREGVWTEDDLV